MAKGRRSIQRQPQSMTAKPSLPISESQYMLSMSKRTGNQKVDDGPPIAAITPPKHVPIPEIPCIQEFTFELFMLLFSIVCLGLQYLNLYRTIFWLPQTYTKYAMHFHLIDKGLVYFIVILLARKFVWTILKFIITRIFHFSYWKISLLVTRILFMIALGGLLAISFYYITSTFNVIRIIALFYPFTFYVFKFNLDASAFLQVIPTPIYIEDRGKNSKNDKKGSVRPIHHLCANSAEVIRNEVTFLKEDCNKRIAQVIFQTIMIVHYTSFVPCIFSPSSLYYDYFWVKVQTFFIGTTTFVWHLIYCFPARYCDILHRSSLHLGGWSKLVSRSHQAPFNNWNCNILWPQGALVKSFKEFYRAEGITNAAEPGNSTHARLFALFNEPWKIQLVLVIVYLSCSLIHLGFLVTLHQWQQVLATALVLGASYAALYVLFRDYLVLKKVYTYEQIQQGKYSS